MSVVAHPRPVPGRFDAEHVRADFPALAQTVHGKPLAYLDNAATTQKPRAVIDAVSAFYTTDCANVHRGVYEMSHRATEAYEGARRSVQRFLGAERAEEVVFVRGATEGINLVAQSFARPRLGPGDEVLVTGMEHHSNIVPWQIVCAERGARLRVAPIDDRGQLMLDELEQRLTERTRLVAVAHVSNALGTVNPVAEIAAMAHARGIPVLVDGAQAVPHLPVDVQALGADFYAFSGHKVYGPTGSGAVWGRYDLLAAMPPYQGGGEMIRSVTFEHTEYADPPHRFEAGTPDIAAVIGLGVALEYLEGVGREAVAAWEAELLEYATTRLGEVPGLRLVGTAEHKASVLSFVVDGVHPHDVGTILDREGVAVRAGHHCAQPVMDRFGVPATVRASLAFYNTPDEVDALVRGLDRVREVFG